MWSIEAAKKARSNYILYGELKDEKYEIVKNMAIEMTTYTGVSDEKLKDFIFSYNLTDQQTAELLDIVHVPNDNTIQSIVRVLLGLILIFYCFPIVLLCFLADKCFNLKIEYKKPGVYPISALLFETILAVIFTTTLYYFIKNKLHISIAINS